MSFLFRHSHLQARNLQQIERFLDQHFSNETSKMDTADSVFSDDTDRLLASVTKYRRQQFKKSGIAIYISDFLYEPSA